MRSPTENIEPTQKNEPFTPWHTEPWVWFILSIILVTFCWGGVQLYTAFTYQDSVVIDDYYKNGQSINQDMTRIRTATQLNISAELTIDELIGEVRVRVQGDIKQWPDRLTLSFLSPVFADKDNVLELNRSISADYADAAYVGQLSEAISGRYYLQLETQDKSVPESGYKTGWRITTEARVVPGQSVHLKQP